MSYNPESPTDREAMKKMYDLSPEPQEPKEKTWTVSVTITREYEGDFYGTKASAEEEAKNYFKRKSHEFLDEKIFAESWEEET